MGEKLIQKVLKKGAQPYLRTAAGVAPTLTVAVLVWREVSMVWVT